MPAGRPSKYEERYCEAIVEHMSDGASVTSFAAEIDVARSTINQWAEDYPQFSEALSRGKAKCASWWEKAARNSARDGEGNATMIVFGLKNMSEDWQESTTLRHADADGGKIDLDPVARATRLASIFSDIEKRKDGE